jgi:hypothetical protein
MRYSVRGAGIIVKIINSNCALSSHLFNVSGSGKTRLSLDGLCSHWGLYISCRTMQGTASGSKDFEEATAMLQSLSTWSLEGQDLSNNAFTARRTFATMLLCARFFILKQLVQRIPVNTDVTDARRRWVLAQVLPPRLRYHGDDLFVRVLRGLQGAETEIMLDVIRSLLDSVMGERRDRLRKCLPPRRSIRRRGILFDVQPRKELFLLCHCL